MLDLAILGLLQEGDLHGYEIRRRLRDSLGLMANISFGSLYPALARLETAGAVRGIEAGTASPLATGAAMGSLSGELAALRSKRTAIARPKKSKKVYRITDAGRGLFTELLAAPATSDDARGFSLRVSFAKYLTPELRIALLQRRRTQLQDRLSEVCAATKRDDLDVYARSVVDHTAQGVRQDIAWLDALLAAERERSSTDLTNPNPGGQVMAPVND